MLIKKIGISFLITTTVSLSIVIKINAQNFPIKLLESINYFEMSDSNSVFNKLPNNIKAIETTGFYYHYSKNEIDNLRNRKPTRVKLKRTLTSNEFSKEIMITQIEKNKLRYNKKKKSFIVEFYNSQNKLQLISIDNLSHYNYIRDDSGRITKIIHIALQNDTLEKIVIKYDDKNNITAKTEYDKRKLAKKSSFFQYYPNNRLKKEINVNYLLSCGNEYDTINYFYNDSNALVKRVSSKTICSNIINTDTTYYCYDSLLRLIYLKTISTNTFGTVKEHTINISETYYYYSSKAHSNYLSIINEYNNGYLSMVKKFDEYGNLLFSSSLLKNIIDTELHYRYETDFDKFGNIKLLRVFEGRLIKSESRYKYRYKK
jgi:hypothetical protein